MNEHTLKQKRENFYSELRKLENKNKSYVFSSEDQKRINLRIEFLNSEIEKINIKLNDLKWSKIF